MIAFRETAAVTFPGPATEGGTAQIPDTEALGDEIARLAAHLHAATYQLLVLIRAFDEREGWACGFRSCAHWLSWRTSIALGPAREKVRVARALADLPLISGAMARGEQSFSKIRALTRVATPENEEELLEVARHATAAHVETLVRAWRRVDRLEDAELEAERHRSRYLRLHPDEDGSWVLRGRLDPEVGALLEKALEWASEALYRKEKGAAPGRVADVQEEETAAPEAEITAEQRRADALGLLAERALAESATRAGGLEDSPQPEDARPQSGADEAAPADGSSPPLGRADRFQVVFHLEAGSGRNVPAASSRRARGLGPAPRAGGPGPSAGSEGPDRSRRNGPAAGLRRGRCSHDPRCRRPGAGCGAKATDGAPSPPPCPGSPRRGLSLSGLRGQVFRRTPHCPLGRRGRDEARESREFVPPSPQGGPRGGIPGGGG